MELNSCAANSVGTANGLFYLLTQTFMAAQCGLRPNWPKDYGPEALNQGKFKDSSLKNWNININCISQQL